MKKIVFILLVFVSVSFFSACNEDNCQKQDVFLSPSLVDTKAKILTTEQELLKAVKTEINNDELYKVTGETLNVFIVNVSVNKENKCKNIEINYQGDGKTNDLLPFIEKLNQVYSKLSYQPAILKGKNVNSIVNSNLVIKFGENGKIEKDWSLESTQSQSFNTTVTKHPDYFIEVEIMPEIVGGFGEIAKKIIYPEIAKRAGIEGKVLVKAYVNELGEVADTEIIKGIGAGCDEVAANAVKSVKFKPGMQDGKPVKVVVIIPIMFKLQ